MCRYVFVIIIFNWYIFIEYIGGWKLSKKFDIYYVLFGLIIIGCYMGYEIK